MKAFKKLLPYVLFFVFVAFSLYALEALKVTSNGKVGIGVSNPQEKLEVAGRIKDATGFVAPVGMAVAFCGTNIPDGWLLCNGAAISRNTYANLWAAIGTYYGTGDGSSTFNLPDFRGMFLRGVDNPIGVAANNDPDTSTRVQLPGSVQTDAFQGHWHKVYGQNGGSSGNYNSPVANGNQNYSFDIARAKETATDGTNGTPRISSETRPKNVYVNYIIKY